MTAFNQKTIQTRLKEVLFTIDPNSPRSGWTRPIVEEAIARITGLEGKVAELEERIRQRPVHILG